MECEIQGCKGVVTSYCSSDDVFVCEEHKANWCIRGNHGLMSLEDGLKISITQIEQVIKMNMLTLNNYRKRARMYQRELERVTSAKSQKTT